MKIVNGRFYYEVGDILYYPYPDLKNQKYIIEELKVALIDNGCVEFEDSKHYQKRIGLEHSHYSQLYLNRNEALACIETNPFNFNT